MFNVKLFGLDKFFLFVVLFLCIFASIIYYHIYSISILEKSIHINYQKVVDVTKRFHGYYINSDMISLKKGVHDNEGVGVIVNKQGDVKVLSPAINQLYKSLSEVIEPKYIWTVAVIDKLHNDNTENSYFKPLRDGYLRFNNKSLHDSNILESIVNLESLKVSYKSFHHDDVRITEIYKEQWTGEEIYSVIYPIYLNTKLTSVIIVDIKRGWNSLLIEKFNQKRWTHFDYEKGVNLATFTLALPYTSDKYSPDVSIDLLSILIGSFYISFIVFFAALCGYYFYVKVTIMRSYDHMTGFYRRDFYEPKLKALESASFLMIDIDHFKRVNDTYGHDFGDVVIQEVAHRIQNCIRVNDVAIRWGGEEFIVIFQKINQDDLMNKAESIREVIESKSIDGIEITISIGGATQRDFESVSDAIKRADIALYYSKNAGRNIVTLDKNNYDFEQC
ncbi:GGDEF domain-containing protein [Aliivibrio fischeri]|uniref:GGDEF domain-containing protein n=1 Tax=Aliivibrio fischeri TaxID=668 RepID=UPI0012D9A1ED|nr:GGDEF domain-containing protein [Aliivibrio fischeri]MUI56038.1 diguanylate cyclase [Aliivibrio fischeri]